MLPSGIELVSLADLNWYDDIEETGHSLEENSKLKAQTVFDRFGQPCFAEDTGLMVDRLDGAPGVYSARYAGEPANAEKNMTKLLRAMEGIKDRSARFATVITFISSTEVRQFRGEVEGWIALERSGEGGFGYDPIFRPAGKACSFAEMEREEKAEISHRRNAMEKFLTYLKDAHSTTS